MEKKRFSGKIARGCFVYDALDRLIEYTMQI